MKEQEQSHIIQSYAPPSLPPSAVPSYAELIGGLSIGMLEQCLYSYIYVWTKSAGGFWMYPVSFTMNKTLFGYQWDNGFWDFTQIDATQIDNYY
jgi:hypothetical protein